MDRKEKIEKTELFSRKAMEGHDSGHDWWHLHRVRNTAMRICSAEGPADSLVVEIGALLHDVGDHKFKREGTENHEEILLKFLNGIDVTGREAETIVYINRNISFSKGKREENTPVEFRIVQDADRLDAIGAIGIARAFSYGGFRNRPIYDPYNTESTISHFHEKLLKLRSFMNTSEGIRIAEERHLFLERYLNQFMTEWSFGSADR